MRVFAVIVFVGFMSIVALICCTTSTNVRETRCTILIFPEDYKGSHEKEPQTGTGVFGRSPSDTVEPWIAK
jgi:hypothetical protein